MYKDLVKVLLIVLAAQMFISVIYITLHKGDDEKHDKELYEWCIDVKGSTEKACKELVYGAKSNHSRLGWYTL